ncbi:MAG: VCBS repeat-containing protein [Methylococcaceae bacterium]|nr:VCBS repeat-containing protein [Methylococcaceae bacterium]
MADPLFNTPITNPFDLIDVGSDASPSFVDVDGDGDLDVFIGNGSGNTSFFRNNGTVNEASFVQESSNFGLTDVGGFSKINFADIDGDGDQDAFIGNGAGNTQFFRNTGTDVAPSFVNEATNFGLSDVGSFASPTFADIDGDGDLDAFVGERFGNTQFFRNTGTATTPNFVSEQNTFGLTDIGAFATPSFVDVDKDGDLDAFVGQSGGNILFFRNTGTVTTPNFVNEETSLGLGNNGYFSAPSFADIDGDGDMDAFIGNNDGNILYYLNNINPDLVAPSLISYNDTRFDDNFAAVNGVLSATDADGDTLSYGIVGGLDMGDRTVSLNNTLGTLTVNKATGDYNFVATDSEIEALSTDTSINFIVTVSDNAATVNQTLTLNITQSGVTETNGNDVLTGTAGNDSFDGLAGNDRINGLGGADTMRGGLGNDIYVVEDAGDKVIETSALTTEIDRVTSTVSYVLTANVENLTLIRTNAINGTGNQLKNVIIGNDAANLLNGGGGVDSMTGGLGNDNYIVDNIGDKVIETSALVAELDKVTSSVTYTLTANVENLSLSGLNAINGTGNTLNNVIIGNSAANTLNGGAGADSMTGGLGNDAYIVENIGDNVIETSALTTEIDRVVSTISYTLKANVENLILSGVDNLNGKGNTLNNILIGNSGNNILNGLEGIDIMTGGLGKDLFRLTTLTRDRITDFNVADDTIQLENGIFTQLTTTGVLSVNNFKIGVATDADDFILYNSVNGVLTYDSNGNGAGGATQIAVLGIGLALTNADFGVI